MSVNRYNPITGSLMPIAGLPNHITDEMVAQFEPTSKATHAYAVGEQFICNGSLLMALSAINIGDTIAVGTNCKISSSLTEQIKNGGGGGGTSDYDLLSNKPSIEGHTLSGAMKMDDISNLSPTFALAGQTKYSATWLSKTDGGSPLTPAQGMFYFVRGDGIYTWNGTSYEPTNLPDTLTAAEVTAMWE